MIVGKNNMFGNSKGNLKGNLTVLIVVCEPLNTLRLALDGAFMRAQANQ